MPQLIALKLYNDIARESGKLAVDLSKGLWILERNFKDAYHNNTLKRDVKDNDFL